MHFLFDIKHEGNGNFCLYKINHYEIVTNVTLHFNFYRKITMCETKLHKHADTNADNFDSQSFI